MKYDYTVIKDGITYKPGEEVPDFGSIVCTSSQGMIRNYELLSADVDKLPLYVKTGSSAYCIDNGDFYKFEATTKTWYKQ